MADIMEGLEYGRESLENYFSVQRPIMQDTDPKPDEYTPVSYALVHDRR